MSKRITIVIDEDINKKLRLRQAKIIQQEQASYSYSRVVNDTLRKVLKWSVKIVAKNLKIVLVPIAQMIVQWMTCKFLITMMSDIIEN